MPNPKKPSNDQQEFLTDVARKIGSSLGEAAARAGKLVEGVKAAASAGAQAYSGASEPSPARAASRKPAAKGLARSARQKSKSAGSKRKARGRRAKRAR